MSAFTFKKLLENFLFNLKITDSQAKCEIFLVKHPSTRHKNG